MTTLRVILSRLAESFRRGSREAALRDDIRAHLDLLTTDYIARGLSPEEARLAARKAFGGVDQITEAHRDQRGVPAIEGVLQDVRLAARLFARDRWLTVATVMALALGMGGSATILSIVYSMNLRELPFDDPAAVVAVRAEPNRAQRAQVPFAVFEAWQAGSTTLAAMAAHVGRPLALADDTHAADQLSGLFMSHNTFGILPEHAWLGRGFRREDDNPGAARVAILSYGVWAARYGSDPAIVGRTVRTNGEPATIVGVMREGFAYPVDTEIWLPLAALPAMRTGERDQQLVQVLARLADGTSIEQARSELAAIVSTSATIADADRRRAPVVLPLNDACFGAALQTTPVMLFAATLIVLLIACSHAASLLLARSAARSREIAMKTALGASRGRIVRQLLIESVLMALLAGLLAVAMASLGLRAFADETLEAGIPYWTRFALDARLFSVLAVLSGAVGIGFGLLPALQLSNVNLTDVLSQGGRAGTASPRAHRMTSVLLVVEMALTVVLLASAGILVQSSNVLYRADQTVDLDNLWEYRLSLPQPQYASSERRRAFYRQLDERLAAAPGLESASLAGSTPFLAREERGILMSAEPITGDGPLPTAHVVSIGPRYFETLGLRLVGGRGFDGLAPAALPASALVNERFVERFLPDENPIGLQLQIINERDPGSAPLQVAIVGIAPPLRQALNTAATPVVYLPHFVAPGSDASIIIRGQPSRFAEILRQEVRRLDPDLPLFHLQSLERASYLSRWIPRIMGTVFSVVAIVATLLSVLGLYSITAYAASQRSREVGVRMALGATRAQIAWLFLRRVLFQVSASLGVGLAGAAAAGAVLQAVLVDVHPGNAGLLFGVSVLLVTVSAVACLLPARRAAGLDPVAALRQD